MTDRVHCKYPEQVASLLLAEVGDESQFPAGIIVETQKKLIIVIINIIIITASQKYMITAHMHTPRHQ